MAASEELQEISAGPYRFRARVAGPEGGELVLLLHGFPQTSKEWSAQLGRLADLGYRTVAVDQRGYSAGARPTGVEHYRIEMLMSDVLDIASALGHERFHLAGHDWGGIVAWHVAAEHSERLRSLTVVSVPHPNAWARALADPLSDQAERSSYIPMLREPAAADMLAGNGGAGLRAGFEGTGLVGHDLDEYLAVLTEPTAIQAALNWYRAYDFHRGGVGDIAVPTLYVWSSGDNAIAREGAEWTGEYIRAPYQFEILDDVCHWVLDVQPERISELLEQQLGSVKAP